MHSPAPPSLRFTSDIQKQDALNALDALQNLMHLIRMDAADAGRVKIYVEQAEMVLKMQQFMWEDASPVM
jgi:hypothetical protein